MPENTYNTGPSAKEIADLVFRERVYFDASKRCIKRAKKAKGPNIKHAEAARIELEIERKKIDIEKKRLSIPFFEIKNTNSKPIQIIIEEGYYEIIIKNGDKSIRVTKKRISNDVWYWFDDVNRESGKISNWHSENVLPARVIAHDTARILGNNFS